MGIASVNQEYENLRVFNNIRIKDCAELHKSLLPRGPLWRIEMPNEPQILIPSIKSQEAFGNFTLGNGVQKSLFFKFPDNAIGASWYGLNFGYYWSDLLYVRVYNESSTDKQAYIVSTKETGLDPIVAEFEPTIHFYSAFYNEASQITVPGNNSVGLILSCNMFESGEVQEIEGYINMREGSPTGPLVTCKSYGVDTNLPFSLYSNQENPS